MAGPVERQVRDLLRDYAGGNGIDRKTVQAKCGALGVTIFDRLVKMGATEATSEGRVKLREYRPDPAKIEAERARREMLDQHARREQEIAESRRRLRAENEEREREQRMLWANLGDYSTDERPMVIAERAAALRESRAILANDNGG